MAVNGCFHKPEYIFYEVYHIFHKVSYQNEVLTDVIPYGKLMEGYGCFHKLKYICYEASHAFHKVSLRL